MHAFIHASTCLSTCCAHTWEILLFDMCTDMCIDMCIDMCAHRWEIPFFIMDALFNAIGAPMVQPLEGSREAELLLQKLKQTVQDGFEHNMMQSIPHLVLLNK